MRRRSFIHFILLWIASLSLFFTLDAEAEISRIEQGQSHTEASSSDRVALYLSHRGISKELAVLSISALPIFELRGGIPVAINFFKMDWWSGFFWSFLGNIIPIVPLLLFLNSLTKGLSRINLFKRFFQWLFERTKRKSEMVEKYEFLGLMIFVAIPLPMTGAWSGAVAATLFGIKFLPAILSISLGVLIAGVIVLALSLLGIWGGGIAVIVLLGLAVSAMA